MICLDVLLDFTGGLSALKGVSFGSENWSWTIKTFERIDRWETKTMLRLFRFSRGTEETWVKYNTRYCEASRKIACRELRDGFVIKDPM